MHRQACEHLRREREGEDLEFEVTVELLPEIADIAFGEIQIERLKASVDDKTVEEAIGRIADANRERKLVEPARPAVKPASHN